MKHYFDENGREFQTPPDPYKGRSPMYKADGTYNDDAFREMGGRIEDDGEPTDKERVCSEFIDLIEDLAAQTDKITPAEFLAAAQNGISSDLVAFAREREVPEAVITEGRTRIVEIMADALRVGVTWAELIAAVTPEA
jgi:hypothetical protein